MSPTKRDLQRSGAFVVIYVLLDWVSYVHAVQPLGITPWNPSAGLVLVALLRFGLSMVPAAFLAPVIADFVIRGGPSPLWTIAGGALAIASVYVAAARLLQRLRATELQSVREVLCLASVSAAASLAAALLYVSVYAMAGVLPRADWSDAVARYWIGDLNGLLVLAPCLMLVRTDAGWPRFRGPLPRVIGWVMLQALFLVFALWVVFGWSLTDEYKFFYLLFLPVVWTALHWGLPGAALGTAVTQVGLVVAGQNLGFSTVAFIEFQALMLVLACTALMLGAVASERQRARAELIAQQAVLTRALQFATAGEMTATIAHEVNNPIAALQGYLLSGRILLEREPVPTATLADILEKALQEGRRASNVVRTLRDMFTQNRLHAEAVNVSELCSKVLEAVRPQAAAQGVNLGALAITENQRIVGDAFQLHIALRNLVENAVAAATGTAQSQVRLATESSATHVYIHIDDSGDGFTQDLTSQGFETLRSTKPGGMGMGLAIARRIVGAHDGRIEYTPLKHGTRFTIALPRPTGDAA